MTYTEDFKCILAKQDNVVNANLFILRNSNPKKIKVFPEEVSSVLLEKYFETLSVTTDESEFVDFIPDTVEKNTLQVINTEVLDLWPAMVTAKDRLQNVNRAEITVEDYNCSGNTIMMDIEFDNGEHVYFLTVYRNVAAWYRNNICFTKKETGKFHQQSGNVLALTPWVDAVIFDKKCYIINEVNFNRIFKFDEVIKNQVAANEREIRSMGCIDDSDIFMDFLVKSKRHKNSMAKIIMQKRLEKIRTFSPQYIREQIEHQPRLSFISYTENDKIVIDKKSFEAVMGILCGRINLDLITKELNGMMESE